MPGPQTVPASNKRALDAASHDTFVDKVFALDGQQHRDNPNAKRCPKHGGILAVSANGVLYCADTKARTCDHQEMGVVEETQ